MASKGKLPRVLAYDLGGTKIAVGVVDSRGRILEERREPALFAKGKAAVLRQLSDLGRDYLSKYKDVRAVGVASAGPLDPRKGALLDPTNFSGGGARWGVVPISSILGKSLKRKVYLENDAAAAILAEHWVGAAKGYDNAMILTLGTGLGTGIIANGELVRSGRELHPEAGHAILNWDDTSAPCGCGNLGCAEAYLSGRNFTHRARIRIGNPNLSAADLTQMARSGDPQALAAFEEYARVMSVAIRTYAVLYAPEIVVFTGSFAAASDLFLDHTREHLEKLMERRRAGVDLMPELVLSKLNNEAGLLGGALIALQGLNGKS